MRDDQERGVGRPLAFNSPEELEEAVALYFEQGAYIDMGDDKKMYAPTMSGLALALGVDRKTITNYANKDEYFPAIKKARAKVEEALEQRLYGQSVAGVIFNLKNNFGWHDKQELDHTSSDSSMSPKSVDATLVKALADKLVD
jgi:hypothetical protein